MRRTLGHWPAFGFTMGAALALSACSTAVADRPVAPVTSAAVTASVPAEPLEIQGAEVLFWDDATRSARFRMMERYYPGHEVAPPAKARALSAGEALPAATRAAIDAYMAKGTVAGMMVVQDGKVRHEAYGLDFAPDQRWTSFSVAKSFTSTLLGAAVKDGFITSLDDPVSQYVPGLRGSAYDDVTVEQLATMTSGVRWNEDYTDPKSDVAMMFSVTPVPGEDQVVTYMKTLPREVPAGEKFVYKTGETNLIGVLVEKAVGTSLAVYAKDKIADPAGFDDSLFWMSDLTGRNIGGCCLSLTLADYTRFGLLALEGGAGVVPDGWFAEAGKPQVQFGGGFGYGYQWWTYPGENYGAQGIFGQSVTLSPKRDAVITILSNWPTATGQALSTDRLMLMAAIEAGLAQ
ncbi:6-aminohexanoate-oligomer exohydrolase [Alteripontixanthobacter maritimus]|uniref:6-aminohexanoate-oligomer exohydrolase n=1 Tax=Alteripontixanthobacter maritimus TaxID=2161824 RepID=A0A369Q5E7_9SPHN|nr:serine hydrolase domain-containing protein [Alteripontixanthobacter maritimus]RDC60113.1 6-aminohexanoate-oligomer exohydrolase [Alteripontixanthobacter maritimus]